MKRTHAAPAWLTVLLAAAVGRADSFGSGASVFDIEFVAIGDPGNADDAGDGDLDVSGLQRYGGVSYSFGIGKYEISESMIDAANALGSLGMTHNNRGPAMPATAMRWYQAQRFVNWLNTSQGYAPAYKFAGPAPGDPGYNPISTSSNWAPDDAGYDAANPIRNSLAKYVLPTVDEWYKAAYYDAAAGAYYNYPTGSDAVPDGKDSAADPLFDAVYMENGSFHEPHEVTNVGVLSPYGTAGQGGNVEEWLESIRNPAGAGTNPAIRGGRYNGSSFALQSLSQSEAPRSSTATHRGFRVASLAETDYLFTVEYRTATATGPLIPGFDPLPATITATFRLNNLLPRQTVVGLDQVTSFQTDIVGQTITRADLDDFELTLAADRTPATLNWGVNSNGLEPGLKILNNNFTLSISGVDPATEQPFDYDWSESTNDLTAAAPTAGSDFDQSGAVDGADLALWRANFGDSGAANFGDADLDGDVDGPDFLAWQQQFGGPLQLAADHAVPEPSCLVLALLVAAAATNSGFRPCC